MLPNFVHVRPSSVRQAVQQVASGNSHLHAGGTDLLGCLRDGVFGAEKIVSITGIDELRGINVGRDGGIRIGALTTLAQVETNPLITKSYSVLAHAAAAAASPQLRNQGTIGGNLCQRPRCCYYRSDFHCLRKGGDTCYAINGENEFHCIFGGARCYIVHPSDTAPALLALDARVHITGPEGVRGVPIGLFFVLPAQDLAKENVLRPGEIITHITLPPLAKGSITSYRKVRARGSWDFALAGLAVALKLTRHRVDWARVVLSGVAPIPWRALEVERILINRDLNAQTLREAANAATRGAEPMSQNGYKVELVRGIVEEELRAMIDVAQTRG
jgi:xanthine dehydrogenase YagS FAD-binding subunit